MEASQGNRVEMGFVELGKRDKICVGLEFKNSKYEFPSPDPYWQKEMLLGWV